MKILVTAIGSRGDIEPLLAIAEILHERSHTIICLFPEQFRSLAEDADFHFYSLGSEFIALLESPAGKVAMGGGRFGWNKIKAYKTLLSQQKEINKAMMLKQQSCIEAERPDIIVHNGKVIYPVVWSLREGNKTIVVCPVPYLHYVEGHTHVAFHGKNYGTFINKLSYKIANYGLIKTIMSSTKWIKGKKQFKQAEFQQALFNSKTIYTVSPTLFERPDYWAKNLQVLGYHERKKTNHWHADFALDQFLKQHNKIVFVTFGSMINNNPENKTHIILSTLSKLNIPAIINTASGGLIKPDDYDHSLFHFVDRIPYEWIFPKMYAVIHHGGSGTTHTALKYACATMIIPHIIDQYVWNEIIHDRGAGPKAVDISRITARNMEKLVSDLYNNIDYKKNAQAISQQILSEDFRQELHDAIVHV